MSEIWYFSKNENKRLIIRRMMEYNFKSYMDEENLWHENYSEQRPRTKSTDQRYGPWEF